MLVAQVCPRYCPYIGGVETHVKEISERLVERGVEVEVLTTDPSGKLPKEEVINGVRVKRFESWAPGEAYYFSRDLKKYLMKNSDSFDVVHGHSYHAFPALYAAQAKNRNKLVFTSHYHGEGHTFFRSLLLRLYKPFGRKVFENADKIICVSNYEKNLITNNFKIDDKKFMVIPNGVNLEEFGDLKKRVKDCRVILYVGRLERYKGVHFLIKVLPKLDSNVILEIVGKGPYKKSLVKLAKKSGVEGRVRFYQDLPRKELLERYTYADVFVLPSKHEAFGISVAEALASKTPCVVSNTSALREWIDNMNCFKANYPMDVDGLALIIEKVIGREVNQVKLWDWGEVVEKVTELYNDITEM